MSQNVWFVRVLWAVVFILFKFNEISATECGTADYIDPKITKGTAISRGAWPFVAALYYAEEAKFFCGSTVISAKHVLTAAHCVQQKNTVKKLAPQDVTVLLGAYNLDIKIERGVQQRDVDEIFIHPDWRAFSEKYDADLAIFLLNEMVEFTKYIRPICMPVQNPPVDSQASIVGWGLSEHTQFDMPESIPRQTYTKILNDSYCYTTQMFLALFSSTRVFCGGAGGGGSPNKGDSGGGLFVLSDSAWIQYGIISASLSDARGVVLPDSYSLYTNVYSFRGWIDDTLAKSGYRAMSKIEKERVKVDLWCNYEIVLGTIYKCSMWGANVTDENFEVNAFTGSHADGFSEQNVTELWFWTGTLDYIPHSIGQKFKYLNVFRVGYDDRNLGLKRLQRSNFEDMEQLTYLDVRFNNVETIDANTLRDLPNLQTFDVQHNKLNVLHATTFDRNYKLTYVNANSNQLESLPSDLFKNNPLLKEAHFKDNNLKSISTNFTPLTAITSIDFHGNDCIDKSLGEMSMLSEFQTLINFQCGSMRERHFFT